MLRRVRAAVTRSPRPDRVGAIEAVEEYAITIRNLEAIDDAPDLDIKPILGRPGSTTTPTRR